MSQWILNIGAEVLSNKSVRFRVWAPKVQEMALLTIKEGNTNILTMKHDEFGYYEVITDSVQAGGCYKYLLNGKDHYPDPASRHQPYGVHGVSQIISPKDFLWEDGSWHNIPFTDYIIYELHIGTFTKEGTFDALIPYIGYLRELGITAIEIMPVGQFPGERNWGYDGVYIYAPQNTYGGPNGLKRLINACHKNNIAVILDVVYNHLGPEGNYLNNYGYYFTDKYKTPWGSAINFDGPYSDDVKSFFIQNALYWMVEYHVDAFRVDAVHGMYDFSANHFLINLTENIRRVSKALNKNVYIIAESDLNDTRVINPVNKGGFGFDAQWNDDFHHCLHALLTGEKNGYYKDFGDLWHMKKALSRGFVYSGQYSRYRKRSHGTSAENYPPYRFLVFAQNHDQVGNRMMGERLSQLMDMEQMKLAAAMVMLSPYIPLLFMGEEYGEKAPFQYFVSHSDTWLIEAVRKGRKEEFAAFNWHGEVPDPQAEDTFFNSKLNLSAYNKNSHKILFEFYKKLISLRKELPALSFIDKSNMETFLFKSKKVLAYRRWFEDEQLWCVFNFSEKESALRAELPSGTWVKVIESSSPLWGGEGEKHDDVWSVDKEGIDINISPYGVMLYRGTNIKTEI